MAPTSDPGAALTHMETRMTITRRAALGVAIVGLLVMLGAGPNGALAHREKHTPAQLKAFEELFLEQVKIGDLLFHGDEATQKRMGVTLSKRRFLTLGTTAACVADGIFGDAVGARQGLPVGSSDPEERATLERLHLPRLRLPTRASNGAKVPIVVEMSHPMEPDHYITRLDVVNERDPIPSKGVFHFTPANGQVFLAFQARMNEGTSQVSVTAECTKHGRWSSTQSITVADGTGGCASTPLPARTGGPDIHPPRIRIPQLVREGRIRRDALIDVQLAIRHPSRTGLAVRDGRFIQHSEPFYLAELEVFYGAERVRRFAMTPAVSDDPFITFRLRAGREESLQVRFTNSRGQRSEATHPVRLS